MRTTLTLDDDVAVKLKRLAADGRFKDVANRALRLGLQALENPPPDGPYKTRARPGKPRVRNLDNIAEVIAEFEREDWR